MAGTELQKFIQPYLEAVKKIVEDGSGQLMIVGMDTSILDGIVARLPTMTSYKVVRVKNQKDLDPDKKLFILKLENNQSVNYQSLIYYYLELPNTYECTVCLVSTSSLALEFFEKRVRSRFKNKILFVPYIGNDDSKFSVCTTVDARSQRNMMEKYKLVKYSHNTIFELFDPIHFVLLGIAFHEPLSIQTCNEQFKITIMDTLELKRVPTSKVMLGMIDLLDAGVINQAGQPCVDFGEFKAFVTNNCPVYLKQLINTRSKLWKHK